MARFRVGSYDKNILRQVAEKLNSFGITANFNLESKAGKNNQNQDFYRVGIMEKKVFVKINSAS